MKMKVMVCCYRIPVVMETDIWRATRDEKNLLGLTQEFNTT